METIILGNYISNELSQNDPGKVLAYYHQQYPCSNVLTLLYLKLLEEDRPKEYDKVKSLLMLSLYKRERLHQFRLSTHPGYFTQNRSEERKSSIGEQRSDIGGANADIEDGNTSIEERTTEPEKLKTSIGEQKVATGIIENNEDEQQETTAKTSDNNVAADTSVIDKVKKLMNKTMAADTPASIEEEMGMEKTFDAPTIHLEDDQSVVIDSLIAKFGGNPSTIKKSTIIAEPLANYSESSLIEDEDIISETLAIIYAEQGYSGKATKMLQKLSLIFPEKSSIFASHIEMIRNGKYNQIN